MALYIKNVEEMLKSYTMIREAYSNYLSKIIDDGSFSPNEINILVFLYNNPSINTSKKLTVTLGVSKGLISRSVDTLISKGLLIKEKDLEDGRNAHLKLSKKAEPLILQMQASKDRFAKRLIENLDPEEFAIYQKVQNQINENLIEALRK